MRIGRVELHGELRWAVLDEAGPRPLPARDARELAAWVRGGAEPPPVVAAAAPSAEPPVRPGLVVGVGLNYRDHAAEVGAAPPQHPLLFAKPPASVIGPGAPIRVDPRVTVFADWEVELAVVVGRRMQRVSVDAALDHVLGYTVANDVTARDLQEADGQWFRAKSPDTFCPLGPWLVTPDGLDPQALELTTRVNGELVQRSSTRAMRFSVAELLSFCSQHFVLEPGDVLLTGTPPGVGASMRPPRSLAAGDVVEVAIAGIGALVNPVEEVAHE